MSDAIGDRLDSAIAAIEALRAQSDALLAMGEAIIAGFEAGGTLMTAGNGGSAVNAMHLAEELTGRFREDRPALPAMALCCDAAAMTCIANDFGWDQVFSRQVEAHVSLTEGDAPQSCDMLLICTTSGHSANINEALIVARACGMTTMGLLGGDGGESLALCDHAIVLAATDSAAIQDGHQAALHCLCELIERWICASATS